jgi:CheY-like chemotaxis protein
MTSPRILFLDDSPERRKAAGRALSCICVSTVTEFETALDTGHFDSIYLDHDLGGESDNPVSEGPDGRTGMHAVDALIAREDRSPVVVVHTLNPPAAIEMVAKLKRAGFTVIRKTFLQLHERWVGNA